MNGCFPRPPELGTYSLSTDRTPDCPSAFVSFSYVRVVHSLLPFWCAFVGCFEFFWKREVMFGDDGEPVLGSPLQPDA